jgi:DNA-binding NtrC family response regulator
MQILLADPDVQFVHSVFDSWHLPESVLLPVLTERELIATIEQKSIDLAFINVQLLLHDGLDIVSFLKERHPIAEIIVLADHASGISIAENALTRGASRYLKKPIKISALEEIAQKCKQQQRETSANRLMEDHVLDSLLGDTPEMRKILKTVYKIAPTTSTVLITGESGSGKEFLANVVHRLSKRSSEPFVAVNCGAIPENIVESELFGSRKGAFTGAIADKKGLFEAASGGTLFLDEVGELSLATQVKLLRFLQNKEIRRVGDSENRYLDVRIIAATNKNLKQAMLEGKFREDLYYRLNTFHLHLPPLRERQIVIPRLVSYFILKYKQEHGKEVNGLDSAAQMALAAYRYPGNIRELENIIEHAIVLSEGGIIRLEDLPETVLQENLPSARMLLSLQEQQPEEPLPLLPDLSGKEKILTLGELERQYIIHTLTQLKGEKLDEIAKILGISRTTLWRKIKENNIEFSE